MTSLKDVLDRAIAAHRAGRLDEAQAAYEAALALEPADHNALANLGALCLNRGQVAEGLGLIDRSLAVRPDQPNVVANKAVALLMMGRPQDALAALGAASALDGAGVIAAVQAGDALAAAEIHAGALDAYDLALRARPADPEILHRRGMALVQLRRFSEARTTFEALLAADPGHAAARFNLGVALHNLQRFEEAIAALEASRTPGVDAADIDSSLGNALRELGRLEEAIAAYDRSLQARPDARVLMQRGIALMHLQRLDAAASAFEAALALKPDDPFALSNLSAVRLAAGRTAEGWRLFEARWRGAMAADFARLPRPLWLGETPIEGRTILLAAEQGLGDTIQFVRFVPILAARGARVVLWVQPPLAELCRSVQGVAEVVAGDRPPPAFDVCCPLMSLPLALDLIEEPDIPAHVPYLQAPPEKAAAWAKRLGPSSRKRVGLVWSGGLRPGVPEFHAANTRRNVPLAALLPLARADVEFWSLQKGAVPEAELRALQAQGWEGPMIRDVSAELNDFSDTAALIEALDLVISVDTSTAHLAGALGKPVWILNRYDTCWRWMLNRPDTPWYPTARLFRQEAFNDWTPVIEVVAEALEAFAA